MHIDYTINVANLLALAAAIGGFIWGARKVLVKIYLMREEERLRAAMRDLKRLHGGFLLGGFITYSAVELSRQQEILRRYSLESRDPLVMQDMAMNMIACYSLLITRLAEDFPEFQALRVVSEENLKDFKLDLAIERYTRVSNALRFFDVADERLADQVRNGRACALAFTLGSDVLETGELYEQCAPGFAHLLAPDNGYLPSEEVRPLLEALSKKDVAAIDTIIVKYNRGSTLGETIEYFAHFMTLCSQGHKDESTRLSKRLRLLQTGTSLAVSA